MRRLTRTLLTLAAGALLYAVSEFAAEVERYRRGKPTRGSMWE